MRRFYARPGTDPQEQSRGGCRLCSRGGVIAAGLSLLLFIGCATTPPKSSPGNGQTGLASYYAHRFHGRKTASGERFNENALTAAHRSLPFGTRVRVINLKNNRAVTVRINDRGPFIKGRIIDVSYAAARKLKMVVDGIARVRVVKVDDPL